MYNTVTAAQYTQRISATLEPGTEVREADGSVKRIVSIEKRHEKEMTYTITGLSRNDSFIANGVIVGAEKVRAAVIFFLTVTSC